MSRLKDLHAQTFGRLTVSHRGPNDAYGQAQWWCQCLCGSQCLVTSGNLRNAGHTQSCGCWRQDNARQLFQTHAMTLTPEWQTWQKMKNRCTNPRAKAYERYGGRGITVCERWLHSFEHFFADMGPRPSPVYSLDRYPDHNGPYSPENCRWATPTEQARNRRSNRLVTLDGQTKCLTEWLHIKNISRSTVTQRMKRKWSIERALTTPVNSDNKYPS